MTRATTCEWLMVDAYPRSDGPYFQEAALATSSCWLRSNLVAEPGTALATAAKHLASEGWRTARLLESDVVDVETYRVQERGRREFYRALADGSSFNVYVVEREIIAREDVDPVEVDSTTLRSRLQSLQRGGFSLFSKEHRQWANGVSPEGEDFVPIWSSHAEAASWIDDWPTYEVRAVPRKSASDHSWFTAVNEADLSLGIGYADGQLVTAHPLSPHDVSVRES